MPGENFAQEHGCAEYFNVTVKETLQTWTMLETVLSMVIFAVAASLFAVFG